MNRLYVYAVGIRTEPGSPKNWSWRAVRDTHLNTSYQAQTMEYYTPAIGRPFFNKQRAQRLLATVLPFVGRPLYMKIHSNAADVLADSMRIQPFHIDVLHMIAPAVTADCSKNGINAMLAGGYVKKLHIWSGGNDWALKLGKTLIGRLWGYGALGLVRKPKNLAKGFDVTLRHEPDFGHETWFDEKNFDDTMRRFWEDEV